MAEVFYTKDQTKPLNILLVEDDDGDAKAVKRAFAKAKIANSMFRAVDGVEALAMLRQEESATPVPFPVILLVDLNMPRMNGIQLIQEIREDPDLKKNIIFILTTSKSDEDKAEAYDLNVAGYIVKETAGKDFLGLLELIEGYWKLIELPA